MSTNIGKTGMKTASNLGAKSNTNTSSRGGASQAGAIGGQKTQSSGAAPSDVVANTKLKTSTKAAASGDTVTPSIHSGQISSAIPTPTVKPDATTAQESLPPVAAPLTQSSAAQLVNSPNANNGEGNMISSLSTVLMFYIEAQGEIMSTAESNAAEQVTAAAKDITDSQIGNNELVSEIAQETAAANATDKNALDKMVYEDGITVGVGTALGVGASLFGTKMQTSAAEEIPGDILKNGTMDRESEMDKTAKDLDDKINDEIEKDTPTTKELDEGIKTREKQIKEINNKIDSNTSTKTPSGQDFAKDVSAELDEEVHEEETPAPIEEDGDAKFAREIDNNQKAEVKLKFKQNACKKSLDDELNKYARDRIDKDKNPKVTDKDPEEEQKILLYKKAWYEKHNEGDIYKEEIDGIDKKLTEVGKFDESKSYYKKGSLTDKLEAQFAHKQFRKSYSESFNPDQKPDQKLSEERLMEGRGVSKKMREANGQTGFDKHKKSEDKAMKVLKEDPGKIGYTYDKDDLLINSRNPGILNKEQRQKTKLSAGGQLFQGAVTQGVNSFEDTIKNIFNAEQGYTDTTAANNLQVANSVMNTKQTAVQELDKNAQSAGANVSSNSSVIDDASKAKVSAETALGGDLGGL